MGNLFNTDNLFFMSSSGHCGLTCPYCLINPVAKNESSLNRDDFAYLFNVFKNKKNGFIFSGKGDFFASYQKKDKLFSFILDHDVEVMLDINAQFIQECRELTPDQLGKIKQINITMHYHQLKEKKILNDWAENVKFLYKIKPEIITINTVMSPPLVQIWEEALAFYKDHVFEKIGKNLLLICDVHVTRNAAFPEEKEKYLRELLDQFPFTYMLGAPEVMNTNFIEPVKPKKPTLCPASQRYFRVWNDGTVQGCIPNEKIASLGNIKNRDISVNKKPVKCSDTHHCDCGWALSLPDLIEMSWWGKVKSKIENGWLTP
jgi:hypothetical protein